MDEPIKKAGQYPNVAIMAGTNPEEVKKQYGVNSPSVFDEPIWEPQRVERNDNDRNRLLSS